MANSLHELHAKIQNNNFNAVIAALQQTTTEMLNAPTGIERKTSLHIAAEFASPEIIKLLLEQGASTEVEDFNKNHPLHLLVSRQCKIEKDFDELKQSLAHLKKYSANFDARDALNRNAAHIAIAYNNALILPELIAHGTDLNGEDKENSTPLYYFVQKYGTNNNGYEQLIAAGAKQSEHIQPLVFNERTHTRVSANASLSVVQDVADTNFSESVTTSFASESTLRNQIFPLHIVMSQKDVFAPSIVNFLDGLGCLLKKDSSGLTPLDCALDAHKSNFNQFMDIALIPEVKKEILLSCNRLKSAVREDTWDALMRIDSLKSQIEPKLTRVDNAIKKIENIVKSSDNQNSNSTEQTALPPSKRLKEDTKASQSASLFNSKVAPLVKTIIQANEKFYNILLKQIDSNTNKSAILTAVVTQLENTDFNQIKDKDFFEKCMNELKNIIQPSLETSMTTTL